MIINYIKTAIRHFRRESFFTLINLTGLSLGLTAALTISLFVYQETQYDTFHTDHEQIYRLATHLKLGGKEAKLNATHPSISEAILSDVPEVEYSTRLDLKDGIVISREDRVFEENQVAFVDQHFLDVFDFEWIAGNKEEALKDPNSVVFTPALLEKYFGSNDPGLVGESVKINGDEFLIRGIVAPAPTQSHFHYQALVSILSQRNSRDNSWNNIHLSTYVQNRDNADGSQLAEKVQNTFLAQSGFDENKSGMSINYLAQPLADIHLKSNLDGEFETNGNMATQYLFLAIALVIIVLACVNFMNLSTARAMKRAKEVGVRKVLGSSAGHLRFQFLVESVLMTSIAMFIALCITELIRIPFEVFLGKDFSVANLLGIKEISALVVVTLLIGLLAGSYPALFMSSFKPASVLKGSLHSGQKGHRLRNMLVLLQFTISCVLITSTILFQQQVNFLQHKKLGFDKENVLELANADAIPDSEAFRDQLMSLPGVVSASYSYSGPIADYDGTQLKLSTDEDRFHLVNINYTDDLYVPTMKIDLVAGRNFNREFAGDSMAVILNETAARMILPTLEAQGELMYKGSDLRFKVVGIFRDFNFESLRNEVMPLVLFYRPTGTTMEIRIAEGNYAKTIESINAYWTERASDVPFTYTFVDQKYNALYHSEQSTGQLISAFTLVAIVIACLGLLGLAAYLAERRNKEIGIRKAMGASVSSIIYLLTTGFIRLIMISFVVSIPISWYLIDMWLENYAYKISPGILAFLIGGFISLFLAIATISLQSVKAASQNPVDTLRVN